MFRNLLLILLLSPLIDIFLVNILWKRNEKWRTESAEEKNML